MNIVKLASETLDFSSQPSSTQELSNKLQISLGLFKVRHVTGLLQDNPFHLRNVVEEWSNTNILRLIEPTV